MKFVCEHCKRVHDTPEEATSCEKSHEEEIRAKEAQIEANEKINNAINDYVRKYKKFPKLRIEGEGLFPDKDFFRLFF